MNCFSFGRKKKKKRGDKTIIGLSFFFFFFFFFFAQVIMLVGSHNSQQPTFNCFVTDLCVTLLTWSATHVPSEGDIVSA